METLVGEQHGAVGVEQGDAIGQPVQRALQGVARSGRSLEPARHVKGLAYMRQQMPHQRDLVVADMLLSCGALHGNHAEFPFRACDDPGDEEANIVTRKEFAIERRTLYRIGVEDGVVVQDVADVCHGMRRMAHVQGGVVIEIFDLGGGRSPMREEFAVPQCPFVEGLDGRYGPADPMLDRFERTRPQRCIQPGRVDCLQRGEDVPVHR
jgi:hypothetical protein